MGRLAEAEALNRRAVALASKLAADHPSVTQFRNYLAECRDNLGMILIERGRPAEAESEFGRPVDSAKLADDNPTITEFRKDLATHHNFGNLLLRRGRPAEAEAEYRTALTIRTKLADQDPAVPEFRSGIASALDSLGAVIRPLGRAAKGGATSRIGRSPSANDWSRKTRQPRGIAATWRPRCCVEGWPAASCATPPGLRPAPRRAPALYDGLPSRAGEEWFETACCRAVLARLTGVARVEPIGR